MRHVKKKRNTKLRRTSAGISGEATPLTGFDPPPDEIRKQLKRGVEEAKKVAERRGYTRHQKLRKRKKAC